jgi:hypothetical protein
MTHTQRRGVAGVGVAVGVIGSLFLACAPGELPCGKAEWQTVCAERPAGGAGGSGAGAGGSTGGSGGGAGGTGGSSAFVATANTMVKDCAMFNTVGQADMFFKMRCGVEGGTCHVKAYDMIWQDFQSADVWNRFTKDPTAQNGPRKAKAACVGGKLVDQDNWENSVLWAKTKSPVVCPPGTNVIGVTMPPGNMMPMMNPLTDPEKKCIEGFLKALAGL